jgi:hypothetical protein
MIACRNVSISPALKCTCNGIMQGLEERRRPGDRLAHGLAPSNSWSPAGDQRLGGHAAH